MRAFAAPLFGIAVLVSMLAFVPGLEQPGTTPRQAILLVSAPLLLGISLLRPTGRAGIAIPAVLAAMLFFGGLGALRVSAAERAPVLRDLALLLAPWVVAWAAARHASESAIDDWIERAAWAALTAIGAVGLAQAWWGWEGLPQAAPPAAFFVNRNVAAQALVALVPLTFAAAARQERSWARWTAGLAAGAGVALLIATRTRGGWIAALVGWFGGAGLFWIASRRNTGMPWKRIVVPLVAVSAFGLVALSVRGPHALPSVGLTVGRLAGVEGTGQVRLAFWRNTSALVADNPLLGIGAGRFQVEYPRVQAARIATPGFGTTRQPEHAHNDLLELAAEIGIPATLGLAFLLGGAVFLSARRALTASSAKRATLEAARAAALIALLVHGLVSFPLHAPATALLAGLLVGRSFSGDGKPGAGSVVAGAIVLSCLLPALWLGTRELRSQQALSLAIRAHADGQCAPALAEAGRATALAPWQRREAGMAAMIHFDCDRDPLRSLEVLEPALAMHPHQLNLLLATGARRLKAGRPHEAEAAYRHGIEIAPTAGRPWFGLALTLDAQRDRAGAAEACREALRLDPAFEPARRFCIGNRYVR